MRVAIGLELLSSTLVMEGWDRRLGKSGLFIPFFFSVINTMTNTMLVGGRVY